ncbi:uncharacterized protein LOC108680010 [Hyalella azteca]|uniref:Uncharacterized protein LOC108680010 n=1 Tax=Hyalella azteca TaxID=294128 RepID=A0A8B7PDN9_HYAAZ|nr:uncharacterized protein LOC108680010 [Hyalella azteca]
MSYWAVQPKPVEIVPKKEENVVISSSIISHFAAGKQSDVSTHATYQPAPLQVVAPSVEGEVLKKVGEVLAADQELKVFKHKGVNTLIRKRILALENSVVSKTVERPPMQEVDKTIREVKQIEYDSPASVEVRTVVEPAVPQPTANIRALAKAMHVERPAIVELPKLQVAEKPAVKTSILKVSEIETSPKPILTKKYSFDMTKKFHEEEDNDGWKKVKEIPLVASSESDETETEEESEEESEAEEEDATQSDSGTESDESSQPPPKVVPRTKKKAENDKEAAKEARLNPKTVERILKYDNFSECVESSLFESFEEYLRRRNMESGYDPEIYDSRSDYDYRSEYDSLYGYSSQSEYDTRSDYDAMGYQSDDGSVFSDRTEFTNAEDNASFINSEYRRDYDTYSERSAAPIDEPAGRDYDTYSERSVLTYDSRADDQYYSDGADDRYHDRAPLYYSDDDDDRTVIEGSVYSGYSYAGSHAYSDYGDRTPTASEYGDGNAYYDDRDPYPERK